MKNNYIKRIIELVKIVPKILVLKLHVDHQMDLNIN